MEKKKDTKENKDLSVRPPVVVVMGHVDHGKSTLLDYIRDTNIVDTEAGGITQCISAYEVEKEDEDGAKKKITFLDTPGHAAFTKMRERGANIADIAILIVSAEDGVKDQTKEAWKTIKENEVPTIVAINKIDKQGANTEKTKLELSENEIYLEGYGGKIPFVEISAKTGQGIDELLSLINLVAEMEEFKGEKNKEAEGFILEANLDSKRGIQATLLVKNGELEKGMWILSGTSMCPVRILEDFKGKKIDKASFSSPIRLFGFDCMPRVGDMFFSFKTKKEAETYKKINATTSRGQTSEESGDLSNENEGKAIIPVIIKADTSGSIEAIEKEIKKIESESAVFKIIQKGEGKICESDVKNIMSSENGIIVGFNVKTDNSATLLAERNNVTISLFSIIYKMTEWLEEEMETRRPKIETEEVSGKAKILKAFSRTKEKQVLGGKVLEGNISLGAVKILRRDNEIGKGKIINLEKQKSKTSSVEEGSEFGMMLESRVEIVAGDSIENFSIVKK